MRKDLICIIYSQSLAVFATIVSVSFLPSRSSCFFSLAKNSGSLLIFRRNSSPAGRIIIPDPSGLNRFSSAAIWRATARAGSNPHTGIDNCLFCMAAWRSAIRESFFKAQLIRWSFNRLHFWDRPQILIINRHCAILYSGLCSAKTGAGRGLNFSVAIIFYSL